MCRAPALCPSGRKLCVGALPLHQFGMVADFDDAALLHDDDAIGIADGAKPMGDDKRRAALGQLLQRRLDLALRRAVQR